MSDSEFTDGMVLLRHGKMPDLTGESAEDDDAGEQAGSAIKSVLKDKYLDLISDFLKERAGDAAPLLRGTVRFAARASVISALSETLADLVSKNRIESVRAAFEKDEPRRIFLQSAGWGEYVKPSPMKPPTMPSYAPKIAVGAR